MIIIWAYSMCPLKQIIKHMKINITIQPCSLKDVEVITALSIQTFKDTFESANTVEDMTRYIENNLTYAKLQELSENQTHFALAVVDKIPVGYVKLKTGHRPPGLENAKAVEIERL